jgi:hypothetical protein
MAGDVRAEVMDRPSADSVVQLGHSIFCAVIDALPEEFE